MKRTLIVAGASALFLSSLALGQGSGGVRPFPSPNNYSASAHVAGASIAATVLSRSELRHRFATDLSKDYVVVEVAVYPQRGGSLNISPEDFLLSAAEQAWIRPAEPAPIAGAIQAKNKPSPNPQGRRTVDVYPTATAGYESGGYDPVTGRRTSGWYGGVGAGVAVGGPSTSAPPPPPRVSDRDRQTMESELADKSLPQGRITEPTAGYLYYPISSVKKMKSGTWDLRYSGEAGSVTLVVPAPQSK